MPRIRGRIDTKGAIVNVAVEIAALDVVDRTARKKPVPRPMQVLGLIDTGVSRSVIHPMVVAYLGLPPRGIIDVETAGPFGPAVVETWLSDVRITLGGQAYSPSSAGTS